MWQDHKISATGTAACSVVCWLDHDHSSFIQEHCQDGWIWNQIIFTSCVVTRNHSTCSVTHFCVHNGSFLHALPTVALGPDILAGGREQYVLDS